MKTIKNLTADKLRKSILQLAIQGKLVKQNPNDEPASELVKKIYEEKKKLIAEGKIKKDKNESYIFKGDDNCYYEKIGKNEPVKLEDLPFDIPDNWTWIRLKSLANIYNGNSINEDEKKKKYTNVIGRDFIATKDVGFDRTIAYNNGVNIPYELDTFKIAPANKILMCIEGGSAGRKIAITNRDVCFGNKLACFDSFIVNDVYLFNIFQSNEFTSIFKSSLTGIIGGVSINTLKDFIIPLPPLEEQQRIVDKINSFEPLLQEYDNYEKKLTELESTFADKLKKSILQYAIEGKLVKQDPNDEPASVLLERIKNEKEKLIKEGKIKRDKNESYIYQGDDKNYYENLPLNWEYVPLAKLGTLTRGSGIKRNEIIESGYPCIRYGELYTTYKTSFTKTKSFVGIDVFKASHKIRNNDVVMTLTGENKQDISMALAYLGKDEIAMGGDMTCFSNHKLNPLYLVFVINSPYGISIKRKLATGDIIVHMSNDRLSTIGIPVPPIKEQDRIVSRVEAIFRVIG